MKKYLAILVTVILIVSLLSLCACVKDGITIYVPDGAPALSVANLLSEKTFAGHKLNRVITTGEDVVAKCANGEADIAVLPTNAAVRICSTRSDYQILSVNVQGVLYIVGAEHIDSISQLQGETLYSIGLGNTPEYVFKTICDTWGVKYQDEVNVDANAINIQYETDASSIIPLILQGKAKFALIGEPAVTQLQNNAANSGKTVETLFDLQQMWQEATGSDEMGYPQACMIVKKDLLTDKFAKRLMDKVAENKQYTLKNASSLKDNLTECGSTLKINYTADLIERCNITAIPASSAKADIERYLATFKAMANFLPLSDGIIYEASN